MAMAEAPAMTAVAGINPVTPRLHGRAFYESIGSPKMIVAPMVDRSEFVGTSSSNRCRLDLTRTPGLEDAHSLLYG